ncbi:MAG: hypothetical protein IPL96_16975 [Holophagaceae bacterium]|nr:hypothetical protein [Holophagaceae bacterium]
MDAAPGGPGSAVLRRGRWGQPWRRVRSRAAGRRGSPAPASADLESGDTLGFAASVANAANTAVTWQVMEGGGGSVSPSGLYTAPDADGTFSTSGCRGR